MTRRLGRELIETPVATLLLALSIVLVAFLAPSVGGGTGAKGGGGFVLTDLVIGATIVASMLHVRRGDWRARDVARQLTVPVMLIALGALIGSLYAGLHGWILGDLARDAAVVLVFLSSVDILRRGGTRPVRLCYGALGLSIVLGAIQLATSGGNQLRASGTFPNPNVAGNLLAVGLLCWVGAPFRSSTKIAVLGIALVGVLSTSSFGALLQLGVGFGYLGITHVDTARGLMRGRRLLAVIPLLLVALMGFFAYGQLRGGQDKSGFNSARFDRSGSLRNEIWLEALQSFPLRPWGVGPGSVRGLLLSSKATELHSEPLAYLVERGVIGLFGLVLMWWVMLRISPRGSPARAMVLAYIVGSFFRETSHYRHFWVYLALALVAAEHARRAKPVHEVVLA